MAKDFRRIALRSKGSEEGPHAGTVAFRVGGRIFATMALVKEGYGTRDKKVGRKQLLRALPVRQYA
jgi:hypothetical protein